MDCLGFHFFVQGFFSFGLFVGLVFIFCLGFFSCGFYFFSVVVVVLRVAGGIQIHFSREEPKVIGMHPRRL